MTNTDPQRDIRAQLRAIAAKRQAVHHARQALRDAIHAAQEATRHEHDLVRAALQAGIRQTDIALDLGRSREYVRLTTTKHT